MSFSKSSQLPKLPTEMLRERALEQNVGEDFRTCAKVAKELGEQLNLNVCAYHPKAAKIYHSDMDGVFDFGIHDLTIPKSGGIAISVNSSDTKLCNALMSVGFKEYRKDWSSQDRGFSAFLISPWDKTGVNMKQIESLPADLNQALNASPSCR